jgi:23S rRNA (cytosine1962-C5)-methyltransferase
MKTEQKEKEIKIFISNDWEDYELLDTGESEKFERFGKYTFVRPYEDAIWEKTFSKSEWENIDGKFWNSKTGARNGWKFDKEIELKWQMSYKDIKFFASPTSFRHLGFFPEQASQWNFIEDKIEKELKNAKRPIKFLNLFGYTGIASLFALRAGAEVTHVDASKRILKWAKENQELSGLDALPMRIIEDDILKFLEREEKRGNKYDAVIMDPPKFGRGPKGEVWKIEGKLSELLLRVRKVLSDKPIFVILTSYATESSSLTLGYALEEMMRDFSGDVEQGELCLKEKSNARFISFARTALWQNK